MCLRQFIKSPSVRISLASLWACYCVVVFCLELSHEHLQFLVVRSLRPLGWLRPLLHELESCYLGPLFL